MLIWSGSTISNSFLGTRSKPRCLVRDGLEESSERERKTAERGEINAGVIRKRWRVHFIFTSVERIKCWGACINCSMFGFTRWNQRLIRFVWTCLRPNPKWIISAFYCACFCDFTQALRKLCNLEFTKIMHNTPYNSKEQVSTPFFWTWLDKNKFHACM